MSRAPAETIAKLVVVVVAVGALAGTMRQDSRPLTAVPQPPIAGLVDAFGTHAIVALSAGAAHGDLRAHDFQISLVKDARFTETVNDIVVEFGNARYQDIIDRFVAGEDIPYDVLRQVWQNTTVASALWDVPIYEEFFRTVRAVNGSLPRLRRLRVLLGDPPIDWNEVHTPQDFLRWGVDRDRHPAQVVEREVLAKHRRALLIYGAGHIWRKTPHEPNQPEFPTLVRLLERSGARVFTVAAAMADVGTLQPGAASWPVPSLVLLRGTPLGLAKFRFFAPAPPPLRDGDPLRDLLMQDQFDALLYAGPPAPVVVSQLSPALCADPAYMKMRLARLQLSTSVVPMPPGSLSPVDQLKHYCASVTQ